MRSGRCLVLAVAAAITLPAAAHAAPGFLPAESLSTPGQNVFSHASAIDASGAVTVVTNTIAEQKLAAQVRPIGGAFSSVGLVTPDAATNEDTLGLPDGSTLLLWTSGGTVHASRRASGSTSFTALPDVGSGFLYRASASPNGTVLIAYGTALQGQAIHAVTLAPGATTFSVPFDLDSPTGVETANLHDAAIADDGTVFACYSHSTGVIGISSSGTVSCVRRAADGTSGTPLAIASLSNPGFIVCGTSAYVNAVHIALESGGDAHVGWSSQQSTSTGFFPSCSFTGNSSALKHVEYSGGAWGSPLVVGLSSGAGGTGPAFGAFAMGVSGANAVFAYLTTVPSSPTTLTPAVISADGTDKTIQSTLHSGDPTTDGPANPQIAALGDGRLLLVFSHGGSVEGAARAAGDSAQSFGTLTPLAAHASALVGNVRLSSQPPGDAFVSWTYGPPAGNQSAEGAGYDAAGPVLSAITVPASGAPGQDLTMSVAAADTWSGPATVAWAFGDGATGDGASVHHAYAQPGSYTATATATDTRGNNRTASRTVVVAVPAPSGPSGDSGGTEGGGQTLVDKVAPVITALKLSRATFRVGAPATAEIARKKTPKGTAISLALSEPAVVVMTFTRLAKGALRGGKCQPGAKPGKKGKRCTAQVPAGTLTRTLAKTSASVPFSGRIGTKALKAGSYRLSAVATDIAGNVSAAKTASLKIVAK